jgi:hypothetical protein
MISQLAHNTRKTIPIAIAVFLAYILLSFIIRDTGDTGDTLWPPKLSRFSRSGIRDGDFDHISNTTLGVSIRFMYSTRSTGFGLTNGFYQFEHIYAIGLKERTDKRDFLTVSASATGFEVDWVDGVRSQELQQKALPNVCIQVLTS